MASVQIVDQPQAEALTITSTKCVETGEVQITSTEVPASDPENLSEVSDSASLNTSLQRPTSSSNESTATEILNIISTYGLNFERTGSWDGLSTFLPIVKGQIERNEPVKMLLPGFPFKSPNHKDKTLGVLPDLGEEIALKHLNGLAENVAQVYERGAEIHICSDGLVYNDLLGVSDEAVWDYTSAVRQMAAENDLHHIRFVRLWNLLDHQGTWSSKEFYVAHASCIRRELVYRYGDKQFEEDLANKSDGDMRMTHASYLKFLEKDLALNEAYQKLGDEEKDKEISRIAKTMMGRWKAFAAALEGNKKDFVRLSIHDSAGSGKLSMALIPQGRGELGSTPWHSCLVVEEDGRYRTAKVEDVRDSHTLVYRHGRPYFYRAKSDLFDWTADGLNVTFEHLYPCGLIIRPVTTAETNPTPSMKQIPMQKVRHLSNRFSPVVLRGFSETKEEETFKEMAHELGEVLVWPQYGIMARVKDAGRDDKDANNVTSNEAMPMHFDGIFKYKDVTDPATGETKKVLNPPGYQYFTCLATAPKGSGYTLFASSRLFFRYLSPPWSVERLEPVTWGTLNTGFWKQTQEELSLVVRHPVTNEPCLRWHEPWSKTKYSTCKVVIENEEQDLINVVNQGIYDWRACLRFSWETGDLLINDNTAMLHTRTAYEANCDREMWRIHFD